MSDPELQKALEQGLSLYQARRFAEAEQCFRSILARHPNDPNALHLYGLIARDTGRLDLAITLLRKAVAVAPDAAPFQLNLSMALRAAGQLDQAIAVLSRALQLDPRDPTIHRNYAILLATVGRVNDAIPHFQAVVDLKPDAAESYYNLGTAFVSTNRFPEAVKVLQRAVLLDPDRADAHCNLGAAYRGLWQFEPAITHYRRALELRPDYPDALYNLGAVYHSLNDLPATLDCYRKVLDLRPDFHVARSSLLLCMHYLAPLDPPAIYRQSQEFDRQHVQPLRSQIQPHPNDRSPGRRLRIGYVSPDFCHHSVAYFLEPILEHHDRTQFEIVCYSSTIKPDAITRRLHLHVEQWRQVPNVPDDRLAQLIRQDQIDILVDLSGHTSHNRMLTFARKPAPVQVTYLGYPDTTGVSTIDYRLTDPQADPADAPDASLYAEKLLRLPRTAWCYRPSDDAPEPAAPPCLTSGHITFGSFNQFSKVNDHLIALWSRLLHALPDSRLFLKSPTLDEPPVRERILTAFAANNIPPERLDLAGRIISYRDHLACYHQVDLALDSFPYNGTTTTCEALWMGVPVVTLAGNHHVSRVGLALLTHIGLPELITRTEDGYLALAQELARDPAP